LLKPNFETIRLIRTQQTNQINMKANIAKISLLTLFAAAIIAVPAVSRAQDATTNTPATSAPAKTKKAKSGLTFRGAAGAVDTNAMTITVGERTFNVTSETKITKNGQPAVLSDIAVGETIGGAYKKSADGKLNATSIRVGVKKKKETSTGGT
jgi:hypothetical protein